jgi:hypothetical protein
LIAPFRPIGRGLQAKKANSLINWICEFFIEFKWTLIVLSVKAKFQILQLLWLSEGFGQILLIGQEIIFNLLSSLAAKGLVPEYNLIQNALTVAARM